MSNYEEKEKKKKENPEHFQVFVAGRREVLLLLR